MSPQELALNVVVSNLAMSATMNPYFHSKEESIENFEAAIDALSALFPYPELIAKAIGTSGAAKVFGITEVKLVDNPDYVGPKKDGHSGTPDRN